MSWFVAWELMGRMTGFFSLFYTFDGECQTYSLTYSKSQACVRINKNIEK